GVSGADVLERDAGAILLDNGRADVGGPGDGRRVPELLPHAPHDRRKDARRLGLARRWAVLGKRHGGLERPSPRPEVLGRELLAEVLADVRIEQGCRQARELAVLLEAKETGPAW